MFQELVSSKVKRQVAPMRGLVVGMLHGILIAGAVRVTERPPEAPVTDAVRMPIIYEHRPAPVHRTVESDPAAPVTPADAPVLPPAPVDVPPSLPPIAPGPPVDPTILRRILATGTPGPSASAGDSVSFRGVLTVALVDEPAAIVHQPSPRYPAVLQHAGVEGRVLVEFIIDTTGHVEAASFRVIQSSNPGFDAAAGETVRRSVFRPARVRGGPVRQRTLQSIAFRIVPD